MGQIRSIALGFVKTWPAILASQCMYVTGKRSAMAISSSLLADDPEMIAPVTDRRRHKRLRIDLGGRFMRADQTEHRCRLRDISISGAALITPAPVQPGEHIVCYMDEVGRLEGPVYRKLADGFVFTINGSQRAKERLAATLMWLANREVIGVELDQRRPGHERVATPNRSTQIILDDGTTLECHVIDISISGASLATDVRPPIGSHVWIGRMRSQIVRHHETGLAVTFLGNPPPSEVQHALGMITE